MAGERSPNYPSLSLEQAVQSVKMLYQKHGKAMLPVDTVVKVWGYNTLSGPARSRVAALRQYGFIDQKVNGPLRVSNRALTLILRSADSPEYAAALREAALTPPLFRDLYENWYSEPDDALLHHLIADRKFAPEGARRVLASFRSTLDFAGLDDPATMSEREVDEPLDESEGGMVFASAPRHAPNTRNVPNTPMAEPLVARPTPQLPSIQLPLPGLPWATLQAPFPLTEDAWQQMLAVLNAMKPALVELPAPKKNPPPPEPGLVPFDRHDDDDPSE